MDSGKLSYELDDRGNRLIDASELVRVYGDACDFDQAEPATQKPSRSIANDTGQGDQPLHSQLTSVQQQLESETKERQREREHFQQQIEHLQEALKLAQEGHNRATLLLENRSEGAGDWEKSFRRLEERLANQEKRTEQEREEIEQVKKQAVRYKQAYEAEKSKSIWQKLLG